MSESVPALVHRLHPTWIIYSAIRSLRTLAFPIIIMLFSGRGTLFQWLGIGGVLALTAFVVGVRALAWQRFTYEFTERGIRVRSGLISRQDRYLPSERIQTIDFNENVLHRFLGVVAVQIESAAGAGGGADVVLEAVSRQDGDRLRSGLLGRQGVPLVTGEEQIPAREALPESQGELIATLPLSRLLIAGATSGRVGPALGIVFAGLQFADDILPGPTWDRIVDAVPEPTFQIVTGVILLCALIAWTFAILSTLLTYGNFELRRVDQRLQATYGLLERRRVSIPVARVQAISVSEGILRQPFGFASIRAESAGYGKDSAESGMLMPIIALRDVLPFLQQACPAYAVDLQAIALRHPPARARRRYVLSPVWGALVTAAIAITLLIVIGPFSWPWATLAIPVTAFLAYSGWLRFRDEGWFIEPGGLLVIRGRPLHRVTTITRVGRIQHRGVSENPLQRRAGLATFGAAVASGGSGGGMSIAHLDRNDALELLERLGSARS